MSDNNYDPADEEKPSEVIDTPGSPSGHHISHTCVACLHGVPSISTIAVPTKNNSDVF